jgi:lantibiotic modifying enzyme
VYQLLLEHREESLADHGPLERFAEDNVRVLVRPRQTYNLVLQDSYHPDVLRDALDRDRFFDRLWIEAEYRPYLTWVIPAERADLQRGDIPIYSGRARVVGSLELLGEVEATVEHLPALSGACRAH